MLVKISNDHLTINTENNEADKHEPYWIGSIIQLLFVFTAIGMMVYGNIVGLGFLLFLALSTHLFPLIRLYLVRREIRKRSPDKNLELRYREESHTQANFSPEEAAKRAKNPYLCVFFYLFHALEIRDIFFLLICLSLFVMLFQCFNISFSLGVLLRSSCRIL